MYLAEIRPWFVGIPANPPEVAGRTLCMKAAGRDDDPGRTEPATLLSGLPCDREPACVEVKEFRYCSGREKPEPSWRVMTRIPGLGAWITGACVRASDAAICRVGLASCHRVR